MHLVGDIGGTKTHLAIVKEGDVVYDCKFPSADYNSLASIVEEFLKDEKPSIDRACFGIAGPVRDGKCQATNLPWTVDSQELSQKLSIPQVFLINDLEANAWGLNVLGDDQFCIVNPGNPSNKGNQALISAGTGLGEAGVYYDGEKHLPFATEGGHADFAPRSDLEVELFLYLRKKFGHVSYERLLSGPGLANIFLFFVEVKGVSKPNVSEDQLPRYVSEKGLSGECKASQQALEAFVTLYGAEAGNLALKFLALGGVFVGGGIAPKILPMLKKGLFVEAFCAKGRFSDLMSSIPVRVVLEERTALLGAIHYLSVV